MLPAELYQPIIGSLDPNYDRETLLSAAQCCTLLRAESQRILFRSPAGILRGDPDQIYRHKLFLEAIIGAPERLALHVREFTQPDFGWDPIYMCEASKNILTFELTTQVYELTIQALPLMLNLKRLCFLPFNATPSLHILPRCTFQLQVLEWFEPPFREDFACSFFPSQHALQHISVFWKSDTGLPRNILPHLVSIRGSPLTLAVFTEAVGPGKILAYDYQLDNLALDPLVGQQRVTNALSGLKCVRTPDEYSLSLMSYGNRLPDSVIVIELTAGVKTVSELLRYTPSHLRALVVGVSRSPRYAPSRAEIKTIASTVFKACSSLKYVEFLPAKSTHAQRIFCSANLAEEVTFTTVPVPNLDDTNWWKRHILDTE